MSQINDERDYSMRHDATCLPSHKEKGKGQVISAQGDAAARPARPPLAVGARAVYQLLGRARAPARPVGRRRRDRVGRRTLGVHQPDGEGGGGRGAGRPSRDASEREPR